MSNQVETPKNALYKTISIMNEHLKKLSAYEVTLNTVNAPILEISALAAFVCVMCSTDLFVYIFKTVMVLNVIISGITLSSLIVGKYIYERDNIPELLEYDTDEEEDYEDKYNIDFIEDTSGNPTETFYISDVTPDGIVFMKYNNYKEGFEYWSEKSVKYDYLETVCRKYVKMARCKNMYIDRKRLLKEKQDRLEMERKEEEERNKMKSEDFEKLDMVDDDDDDVFAKLKTNVDKRYENKGNKKNLDNVVDDANKYIYMGKLNEMSVFTVTRTDELSDESTKKNVSFSMFKALGLS
jgi:hypothetical protein